MEFIVGLLAGAIGGNAAAAIFRNLNQGMMLNTLAGLVGGVIGGALLNRAGIGSTADGTDLMGLVGQIAGGGLGGGLLLALLAALRNARFGDSGSDDA